MARIEDLLKRVSDPKLRFDLEREVKTLKREKKFGLVFDEHIPENALLYGMPIKPGARVTKRGHRSDETYVVVAPINGTNEFRIRPELDSDSVSSRFAGRKARDEASEEIIPVDQLVAVKHFGEPIYPAIMPIDNLTRAPGKPYHTIINADNFHALQLLVYCYEAQVDLIYIDPPYNTGARDWKYNNNYVDGNDPWQHSKWLSFIDKRLRLARRLLKPDGVLIVTIDEHEIHHLGCLLAQAFPTARRQMVTIVNNAAGVTQGGFYRVEEYAFFCFFGQARPVPGNDDLLSDEEKAEKTPIWFSLIRYGGINALPSKRPGLVYPIGIDPARNQVASTGRTLKQRVDAGEFKGDLDAWRPDQEEKELIDGYPAIWPFRGNGSLSTWQLNPERLVDLAKEGFVRIRPQTNGPGGNAFSISYIKNSNRAKILGGEIRILGRESQGGALILAEAERNVIPKTVWKRVRHDAGKWGSRTIREVLGNVSFDYAKSPYAVLDALRSVLADRPDALILDFFAGSGTTLHATALLNAEDNGQRRCILVTNNEVYEKQAKLLNDQGYTAGDPEFEQHGICQSVTWPRCKYVINGRRDDGTELPLNYLNGREMKQGFEENLAYFTLGFLDPHGIARGDSFEAILPVLWLIAGAQGERETARGYGRWFIPKHSPYAVLIDEDHLNDFKRKLKKRPDITHVFLVTDSDESYRDMAAELPGSPYTRMLYKSYLENFKINIEPRQ